MTIELSLADKLEAVDINAKILWDRLDDAGRKKLKEELFILNRYISNVAKPLPPKYNKSDRVYKNPSAKEVEHYILAVNENYNKHWAALSKHPKLQWMLLCMCSYDSESVYYHEWIGHKRRKVDNKKLKFLEELYPDKNDTELELLAAQYTNAEIVKLAKGLGMDDVTIKKTLK